MPGGSATNKYDVEIESRRERWAFWHRIADGLVNLMTVGSVAIPVWILGDKIVAPLAGHTTNADINVNLGVGITLAGSLGLNTVQALKGSQRKRTIREQRQRMDRYEEERGLPAPRERHRLGKPDV